MAHFDDSETRSIRFGRGGLTSLRRREKDKSSRMHRNRNTKGRKGINFEGKLMQMRDHIAGLTACGCSDYTFECGNDNDILEACVGPRITRERGTTIRRREWLEEFNSDTDSSYSSYW